MPAVPPALEDSEDILNPAPAEARRGGERPAPIVVDVEAEPEPPREPEAKAPSPWAA
jgi:hypothetical protein